MVCPWGWRSQLDQAPGCHSRRCAAQTERRKLPPPPRLWERGLPPPPQSRGERPDPQSRTGRWEPGLPPAERAHGRRPGVEATEMEPSFLYSCFVVGKPGRRGPSDGKFNLWGGGISESPRVLGRRRPGVSIPGASRLGGLPPGTRRDRRTCRP